MLLQAAEQGQRATQSSHGKGVQASVAACDPRPTLTEIGLTKSESSRYQQLARMSNEHFEAAVATAKDTAGRVTTAFARTDCGRCVARAHRRGRSSAARCAIASMATWN